MSDTERMLEAAQEAFFNQQDALIKSRHEVETLRAALTTIAYPPSDATDWSSEWNPILTARAALESGR